MLAILVDPMADVWMASVIILVLVRVDSKRTSQTLARSSVETSMIAAHASSSQMSALPERRIFLRNEHVP